MTFMKNFFRKLMVSVPVVLAVMSCTSVQDNSVFDNLVTDDKPFSFDQYMDESVRPGNDFFRYLYGKWLDSEEPSLPMQSIAKLNSLQATVLSNSNDPVISHLRSMAEAAPNSDADMKLLGERLSMVSDIKTQEQLLDVFAKLHQLGYTPLLRVMPGCEARVIKPRLAGEVPSPAMLELLSQEQIDKALDVITKIVGRMELLGFDSLQQQAIIEGAKKVERLEFEIYDSHDNMILKMTQPSPRRAQRAASENKRKFLELIGMGDYADTLADEEEEKFNQIVEELLSMLFEGSEESVATMRNYLMFYMVGQDFINIPQLQDEYAPLNALIFAMKNARYYMYRQIAEFVGLQNIQKEKCTEIMEKCRQIMHDRIENLEWMSSTTKQAALKKLSEMLFFIGYPDKWNEDFTPVVEGNTLLETVSSLRQQNTQILRKLIGRSDVESSWDFWCYMVTFNTYNAMYMPTANELIILPAFLMAPMFDITQSDATLYGTAYVFAHEMCHGFDARGAEYDEYGNKRDWWTAEDNAKFKEKQQQLIDLWGQLEHMPGLPANGEQTLTENMADYGGAILASEAYKMRLKEQGYSDKGIDIQMKKFFSSFGLNVILFEHERNPEMLRRLYDTDVHSAGHNRVNGIVRLFDDWYRLYDVQPEDKLYLKPKDRVKIW